MKNAHQEFDPERDRISEHPTNATQTLQLSDLKATQRTPTQSHAETRHAVRPVPKTVAINSHTARTTFQQRHGLTSAINKMLSAPEQDEQFQIRTEHLLVGFLLGLIFLVRFVNLNFNTLHLDEAIYTTVGEEVLSGSFEQGASQWMYGSYMYPIAATVAEQIGGVVGLRALSALLTVITAFFVFLTTQRVFNSRAALLALFVFGFTGISINVGQHATYDVLSLPFMAAAVYFATSAMLAPDHQRHYLRLTGIMISLSVLAKYIAVLMLPALLVLMLVLHLSQGRGLVAFIRRTHWWSLISPVLIILGIYGAYYARDLRQALTEGYANQPEPRPQILGFIVEDIGLVTLLAAVSLSVLVSKVIQHFRVRPLGLMLPTIAVLPMLLVTMLMPAVYHMVTGNGRSMWKHNVYSLIFLAPLAGYVLAEFIDMIRAASQNPNGTSRVRVRTFAAALTVAVLLGFLSNAFHQNDTFHHMWPNNNAVMEYMASQNITPESRVLSAGYAIYDYYFDFGTHDRNVWNNIWYTEYGDLSGTEAVEQAIRDCAYDMVVLDNYWAPEWGSTLMASAVSAGYVTSFTTAEKISGGDIITQVYQPGESCGGQS